MAYLKTGDTIAVHDGEALYRGRYAERGVEDDGKVYPKTEHPVVRTHPATGRQALYVNRTFTTHLQGYGPEEGEALLNELFLHVEKPEFQVRYRWEVNDVAFWDNRCTLHYAIWDYKPQTRKGHRVTIKGERPFYRPE